MLQIPTVGAMVPHRHDVAVTSGKSGEVIGCIEVSALKRYCAEHEIDFAWIPQLNLQVDSQKPLFFIAN